MIYMGACHYDNMSMKYALIFKDCNSDKIVIFSYYY